VLAPVIHQTWSETPCCVTTHRRTNAVRISKERRILAISRQWAWRETQPRISFGVLPVQRRQAVLKALGPA
jgi:hypothetical protein